MPSSDSPNVRLSRLLLITFTSVVEITFSFPSRSMWEEGDPRWAAAELSHIIARERLRDRVRERDGLAYYVSRSLVPAGDAYVLEIASASVPEQAVQLYRAMREEMGRLAAEGPSPSDVTRARLVLV